MLNFRKIGDSMSFLKAKIALSTLTLTGTVYAQNVKQVTFDCTLSARPDYSANSHVINLNFAKTIEVPPQTNENDELPGCAVKSNKQTVNKYNLSMNISISRCGKDVYTGLTLTLPTKPNLTLQTTGTMTVGEYVSLSTNTGASTTNEGPSLDIGAESNIVTLSAYCRVTEVK